MAKRQTGSKDFLTLVRRQLGNPDLSLDEAMQLPLAESLIGLLAGNSQESSSKVPDPYTRRTPLSSFVRSQAVLLAAIQDTFSLEELSLNDVERTALIAAADVVMLDGRRRLCLTDEARAELLAAASGSVLYKTSLRDAADKDRKDFEKVGTDPIRLPTAWLRAFLLGDFGDLGNSPRSELAAALTARQRLRLVPDLPPSVPTIADLERRVSLAELLEPLRLLIGAEGGWDGVTPRSDRFVGRQNELALLRGFVDELSSQSIGESLRRLTASAASAFGLSEKPNLRLVQADGGLGKSALLAKFVLDHALDQKNPFPFAYLDFDSAALDPNQPNQLLIEMARQVGLQFPSSQPDFSALLDDIRQDRRQSSPAVTSSVDIRDPFANFVEILRKHATLGTRAFLLILDTLEVVQWNPMAVDRIASILYEFRAKGLVELRVVASGRADIPELRAAAGLSTPDYNIQLRPLSVDEAVEMANRLGKAAIKTGWDVAWSRAIVGDAGRTGLLTTVKRVLSTREDVRREPLTVRVAVDLVLQVDPSQREGVVAEIKELSDNSQASLAARLYQRRIVSHVRNSNARKLAWPGLVLRRVTPEIAKNLLAPLCKLAPEHVDDAYQALAKEVWMVIPAGDGLKHRPDLRSRMLPLMRASDPELFETTARAAVDYFGRLREGNREDRAEWIYQRFLIGSDINDVAADITPEILPKLAGAAEDFPQDSEAASFLTSRTATARLSPTRIQKLTANDALFHFSATSQTVFGLDDVNIDQIALLVSQQLAANPAPLGDELAPWAQALWIKTGMWGDVDLSLAASRHVPKAAWRALLYWAARSLPSLPAESDSELLHLCLQYTSERVESGDQTGFRSSTQALALARSLQGSRAYSKLDQRIAQMLSGMKPNALASTQAALRTAIIFGDTCRRQAITLWLTGRRRGARDRVKEPTFSSSELRTLARIDPEALSFLTPWGKRAETGLFRIADEEIVSSASQILEQFLASPLDDAGGGHLGRRLAQVFACRDEDWIIPFGYTAERMTEGQYSAGLRERIASYADPPNSQFQAPVPVWNDMLGAMRIADEAGDLSGFATLVLEQPVKNREAREDLVHLLYSRDRWSRLIEGFVGGFDRSPGTQTYDVSIDPPPLPGPGPYKDDPQRGRWGGNSEIRGRALKAVLESAEKSIFYFSLIVESTDGSELNSPVVFHLHDSYPRSIIHIRHIVDGKHATLSDWSAYGVFTVGVQVKDRTGTWISLELNLASLRGLPKRFLTR
jgi:hypothetical protein